MLSNYIMDSKTVGDFCINTTHPRVLVHTLKHNVQTCSSPIALKKTSVALSSNIIRFPAWER